jgi:cytochrome c556
LIALAWVVGTGNARAQDSRALVRLPEMMQEHMLANMRDHLLVLSEILANLAESKLDAAAKLAEQRLGMSSLERHGAGHMAPYMPKPMQDIGTSMHRAASRFGIVAQNAAVTPSLESMREVFRALHEVTATCAACHAGYRIR